MQNDSAVVEIIRNPTAWGVALAFLFIGYLFFRDIRNPEKAASASVLEGLTATTADVFAMATQALAQAKSAADDAAEARQSQARCAHEVDLLIHHNRQLTLQLTMAGIVPAPPPTLVPFSAEIDTTTPHTHPPEVG